MILKLIGEDGNAMSIISRASAAMRKEGYTEEEVKEFQEKAFNGTYHELLQMCCEMFDVE